ncbi:two-component response regulator, CheY subfamily protein [Calothrix sp. NIES-4071]|nr:two-component response regulator, CheY subfamily protein [Calothrix sp. NIES-4071]BAZ63011.1 two-component response regulator, CheY subfamily protein [Calothrix sp. NIES-4105]
MSTQTQNNYITASTKSNTFVSDSMKNMQPLQQMYLLQAVIEGFVDGIIILTSEMKLLHVNQYARELCNQLVPGVYLEKAVPEEICNVCESLIDSREIFPNDKIFMEFEVEKNSTKVRIRARWLEMNDNSEEYIIVTLEDCNESNHSIAIQDAKKYGLTERETQVWLLRKANLSYKEIAARLYITINTVKKHLKSIYAKQQDMIWLES